MGSKDLYKAFLDTFGYIDKDFKIKVSGSDVRKFLKQQGSPMTFQAFNKRVECEGRTTDNKYVYNFIKFKIASMERVKRGRENEFSDKKIKTLNYYGTKKCWKEEFELIYEYAHSLGCTMMVDAFGGSGFLALLASRTGLFRSIVLNERSDLVYNYHFVQKDEDAFDDFIRYLVGLSDVDKNLFEKLRKYIQMGKREERKHIGKPNATKAAALFVVTHYAHSGQGGYIKDRKAPSIHTEALEKTHELYDKIELKHYHYAKLVREYMHRKNTLAVLDPPYLDETRVQKQSYNMEYNKRKQHEDFLGLLTKHKLKGRLVICGYHSQLYEETLKKCNRRKGTEWHEVKLLRPGRKGTVAKERIWVNFDVANLVNNHTDLFELIW